MQTVMSAGILNEWNTFSSFQKIYVRNILMDNCYKMLTYTSSEIHKNSSYLKMKQFYSVLLIAVLIVKG